MAKVISDMIEEEMRKCAFVQIKPPEHMPEEAIQIIKVLSEEEPWDGQIDVTVRCDYETSKLISRALMSVYIKKQTYFGGYEAEIYGCCPFIGCRYSERDGALTLFVSDEFCKEFTQGVVKEIDRCNAWDELLQKEGNNNG